MAPESELSASERNDRALAHLLRSAGASSPSSLTGRLGSLTRLFEAPPRRDPAMMSAVEQGIDEGAIAGIFEDLPFAHLTILEFAFHSLYCPIRLTGIEDLLPVHVRPACADHGLANIHSGAFDLAALYFEPAVSGDVKLVLSSCLLSPWDPAQLWLDERTQSGRGDLLRLHDIIANGGALLDENWFAGLPPVLRDIYFDNGDLRLDRAIIPDLRNDRSLLLSQFHSAVARYHNAVADDLDAQANGSQGRHQLYVRTRRIVTGELACVLLQDTLPRVIDPEILTWSLVLGAPCHARATAGARNAFPIEAAVVLSGLVALHQPASIYPNMSALISGQDLSSGEMASDDPRAGLPRHLFVSQRVPTRLSTRNFIDWRLHCGGAEFATAGRKGSRFAPWRKALTQCFALDSTARLPSGQACLDAANRITQLGIPAVNTKDIHGHSGALGRAEAQETPLLIYVIAEARQLGKQGRLGPLGSLIVAETFVGAIQSAMPDLNAFKTDGTRRTTLVDFLTLDLPRSKEPR